MNGTIKNTGPPAFYTVSEAARILRVVPATLYRAIRDDAFPALKIRGRYVIPASALDRLVGEVFESGGCVDVAQILAEQRIAGEFQRFNGGAR